MDSTNWIDLAPSALSAVAGIAAAIAAFGSLKVSRESKRIAEQGALALHHGAASTALAEVLEKVTQQSTPFCRLALDIWADWAKEIERHYDKRSAGGVNPRPLRHVLTNASEMLERHATNHGKDYGHADRAPFSIIRNGLGETSGAEYRELLKTADCTYHGFESVFGVPRVDKDIASSKAFRWAHYQLTYRVAINDWRTIWAEAWIGDGWLRRYRGEFELIEPVLKSSLERLQAEKARLQHTVFPLDTPLWQDSWHYLIFNQLGGSGVDSASLLG
ncbi:MAG TPA: hypothetical protein VFN01_17295 [Marinobacter sp.]|uniref:hypothetical protein n=1 Tax=Marinobacter sp. TaxID=50741 RepID=UPI002D7F3399|nr:hypothetical protein [Marinobacter sp.]HET8802927.1 hypothetical protein [Marinobacter sp.]